MLIITIILIYLILGLIVVKLADLAAKSNPSFDNEEKAMEESLENLVAGF